MIFFARDANDPDAVLNALAFKSTGKMPMNHAKTALIKDEIVLDAEKLEKKTKIVRRDVE